MPTQNIHFESLGDYVWRICAINIKVYSTDWGRVIYRKMLVILLKKFRIQFEMRDC